ncbi:zinc finger domain-containing protein [Streptomyces albogriseolus]|uniref:zinc finger domain-containing protein n=2 Tax=Streptomyces albogriseolus TaxID=1887 RepID=UPI003F4D6B86
MDLVRSWMRRVECPTCKAAAGRACRTAGGRPTNEHRARRDAVGPIPYAKWRKEGLIPEQRTYTIPVVLKESEKARADVNVDTALADGVAVVSATRYAPHVPRRPARVVPPG